MVPASCRAIGVTSTVYAHCGQVCSSPGGLSGPSKEQHGRGQIIYSEEIKSLPKGKEPSPGGQEETPCQGAPGVLRAGHAAQMQKQQEKPIKWRLCLMFFILKVHSKLAQSNYFLALWVARK